MVGIPYLLGEFNVKKNRITLNSDKNIIFESSEFSSGGIALLIFGVYRTSRNITSKLDNEDETFLKTEKEDEV